MFNFNPYDHYWLGDDFVYSSSRDAKFPLSDVDYITFLAAGGLPTRYTTDTEMAEILVQLGVKKALNTQLEEAFLGMLPNHLGQPYLTNDLMVQIGTLKQVVTDYNRLGLYAISKTMIQGATLPTEMDNDRDALLALYPA